VKEIMREGMSTEGAASTSSAEAQAAVLQLRGDTLMHAGLRMPQLRGDYQAVLMEITAV